MPALPTGGRPAGPPRRRRRTRFRSCLCRRRIAARRFPAPRRLPVRPPARLREEPGSPAPQPRRGATQVGAAAAAAAPPPGSHADPRHLPAAAPEPACPGAAAAPAAPAAGASGAKPGASDAPGAFHPPGLGEDAPCLSASQPSLGGSAGRTPPQHFPAWGSPLRVGDAELGPIALGQRPPSAGFLSGSVSPSLLKVPDPVPAASCQPPLPNLPTPALPSPGPARLA